MGFYYVYVLKSLKDNKMYIGSTTDLNRRLKEHNYGKNKSTRNRRPLQLIFFEGFLDKGSALRRESYFKTNKGKPTLKIMLKNIEDNQS